MVTGPIDKNGNIHDDSGRFVSLRDYVESVFLEREKQMERIFAERETSAEFKRLALKDALDKAEIQVAMALSKQEATTETKLNDAKRAADGVIAGIKQEIATLQSGGAPFANRLDEGMTKLRSDVDTLNTDAVRTKVLDALREQTARDALTQKKQVRAALVTGAIALGLAVVETILRVFS